MSDDFEKSWRYVGEKQCGSQYDYSAQAITIMLTMKNVFPLPNRATVLIPPRKNAHIWQHGNTQAERLKRDENLRTLRKSSRKAWKENSGYPMRSLAETTMFRVKTIFGDRLSARLLETQPTQALICCAALNRMTHLGMPDSYKVSPAGKPD